MAANTKPGIATAAATAKELAEFTARHRATILTVVAAVSPGDLAAVTAALDAIQTFNTLFQKIYELWVATIY